MSNGAYLFGPPEKDNKPLIARCKVCKKTKEICTMARCKECIRKEGV